MEGLRDRLGEHSLLPLAARVGERERASPSTVVAPSFVLRAPALAERLFGADMANGRNCVGADGRGGEARPAIHEA